MSDFRMPKVDVGEVVLWYPDGNANDDPVPAMVNHVGEYTLSISVISKDAYSLLPEDGVRHMEDPGLKIQENRSRGAWAFGPERRAREALKAHLNELKAKLDGLKGK